LRQQVRDFVRIVSECLDLPEPIYEFGAMQVADQEGWADIRSFFSGKEYVGCDREPGPGVDRVEDLHGLTLPDESAGTVVSLETFEHVEFVRKAADEIYRVTKPDGVIMISSQMDFHIHGYPNDYWRFTPNGFRSLLSACREVHVFTQGKRNNPHTVVGIGFKGRRPEGDFEAFMARMAMWEKQRRFERHPAVKALKRLKSWFRERKWSAEYKRKKKQS